MQSLIKSKADLLIIALCLLGLAMIAPATTQYSRLLSMRPQCATNLSGIGKAMLIYANDYDDELPKAGNRTNDWTYELPDWKAMNRYNAYDITNVASRGKVTISSSLYLLIKYAELTPSQFICRSDTLAREFKLETIPELPTGTTLRDLWDFGPWIDANDNPSRHCSYAYHWPFDAYALTIGNDPGMAVLADRNPWLTQARQTDVNAFADFMPDVKPWGGTTETARIGNSDTHQRDGQNVLFLDMHVAFEQRAFCALQKDNIYTISENKRDFTSTRGKQPTFGMTNGPTNREDLFLIQNPEFEVQP